MILKNVENKENKTATFQVESDAAEFESAVNGAYLKNKASINIPGFRKGKAPRAVVEGMYGAEVFYQDAMDELAPKAFEFGLDESKLRMVGTPSKLPFTLRSLSASTRVSKQNARMRAFPMRMLTMSSTPSASATPA